MDPTIEKAKQGDMSAMEDLVRKHYPTVYRFCARRLGCDIARDIAQETFIAATRSIRRFNEKSAFATWLLSIANNMCRNAARRRRLEMASPDGWLNASLISPESSIVDRETLRRALHNLTPEQREAVLLHEVEGLSYSEAAQVLGVPEGTVKSRLHFAFLKLRVILQNEQEVLK